MRCGFYFCMDRFILVGSRYQSKEDGWNCVEIRANIAEKDNPRRQLNAKHPRGMLGGGHMNEIVEHILSSLPKSHLLASHGFLARGLFQTLNMMNLPWKIRCDQQTDHYYAISTTLVHFAPLPPQDGWTRPLANLCRKVRTHQYIRHTMTRSMAYQFFWPVSRYLSLLCPSTYVFIFILK